MINSISFCLSCPEYTWFASFPDKLPERLENEVVYSFFGILLSIRPITICKLKIQTLKITTNSCLSSTVVDNIAK